MIDTATAASIAGVSTSTIRTWCRTGAVAATKSGRAWRIDPNSLQRRIALGIRKPKRTKVEITAENLEAIGGRRWIKGGHDRIYFNNWPELIGLEINRYKTGNISSAFLDGELISNRQAGLLLNMINKVYWDTQAGHLCIQWTPGESRIMTRDELKQAILDGIRSAIAAL